MQVKCDQYWPSRGTETYGMIQVTMLDTVDLATYSVRTFALYKVRTHMVYWLYLVLFVISSVSYRDAFMLIAADGDIIKIIIYCLKNHSFYNGNRVC